MKEIPFLTKVRLSLCFIASKLCFALTKLCYSLAELDSIFNMVNRFVIDKVEVLRHSKGGNL